MTEENPQDETGFEPLSTGRYAAYDKRYERFVDGVHDTKTKARDAAKDKGVKASDIDVREV